MTAILSGQPPAAADRQLEHSGSGKEMETHGMTIDRRSVLKNGAFGLFAFKFGLTEAFLTPKQARAEAAQYRTLAAAEVDTLEALGEVLVPGSAEQGLAHFVDSQISGDPSDSLLMIRYMDVPPPHAPFYQGGLAALNGVAETRHGKAFADLDAAKADALVGEISASQPAEWQGPPAPLFYFVARADAVDVFYGTEEGFERLGVPYMAHIEPPTRW